MKEQANQAGRTRDGRRLRNEPIMEQPRSGMSICRISVSSKNPQFRPCSCSSHHYHHNDNDDKDDDHPDTTALPDSMETTGKYKIQNTHTVVQGFLLDDTFAPPRFGTGQSVVLCLFLSFFFLSPFSLTAKGDTGTAVNRTTATGGGSLISFSSAPSFCSVPFSSHQHRRSSNSSVSTSCPLNPSLSLNTSTLQRLNRSTVLSR